MLIGRSADAGVVVDVAQAFTASRRAATAPAGRLSCHDAGSSYGTWIVRDGERLDVPVELVAGDASSRPATSSSSTIVELQP